MLRYLASLALLMVIAQGCGGEPIEGDRAENAETTEPTSLEMPEIDHWLTIVDSIGVELGDTNLVFGTIVGAEYLPNGNIAIADMGRTLVNVYSPSGEFIASVGGKGQGPGEYLMLASFAVTPDNGFVIPDAMGGKINFYDSEYGFTHEMTGFFQSPPVGIAVVDGGFVGLKPAWEQNDDEMLTGMAVSLWTDSAAADLTYRANLIPFDMNDMGGMAKTTIIFAVDRDEDVFLAQYDTDMYLVTCYNRAGEELFTIEEEFPMVLKSQEDIEIERDVVRNRMIAGGAPPAMAESYEPDIHRSMIASLSVDSQNRLWVMGGLYEGAVFRVYDGDTGEFLFTAALRADEAHENVMPVITPNGILGFDPVTEEWSRVYMIEPEGDLDMTALFTAVVVSSLSLSPDGFAGITPETTMEYLVETFGEENVESAREHLGEGYYSEGAVVFGGTEREFSVVWEEGILTQIRFQGPAVTTAEGIGIGSTLAELEAVVGEFPMAGFAWDAEGWADLEGTIYEGLYIRLTPEAPVPEEFLGDELFSSADFREYQCRIADLRLFL